jgi:hypothetical protein
MSANDKGECDSNRSVMNAVINAFVQLVSIQIENLANSLERWLRHRDLIMI